MKNSDYILQESIGFLLGVTNRLMACRLNRNLNTEGSGVSFEQWTVLVRLWDKDGQSQQELANNCGRDKTTMTRLLDNLEKQNVVLRVEDKNDRRNKLIYLTNLGKSLKEKLIPVAQQTLDQAQMGISDEELRIFKEVLNKIRENLNQ